MKKILFIIPYIPYPLNSGGNQAFFNMVDYIRHIMSVSILLYPATDSQKRNIDYLRKLWENVTFYIFTKEDGLNTLELKHPFYYRWLDKMKCSIVRKMKRQLFFSGNGSIDWVRKKSALHTSIFSHFDIGYLDYVAYISKLGFDIIQVEFYELISLGYILPETVQTVFLHHELRYIHNENEISLFKKITGQDTMSLKVAKDFERCALQRFKHVIVLTNVDSWILKDFIGNDNIYVSPAVVRTEENAAVDFIPAITNRLTFWGSGNHCPNLDAVAWFCSEIAPCLRNAGVSFTFQVIGTWSASLMQEFRNSCPEMELIGYVEDLHSFVNGSVALVPIRIGSGMRMKILDAVFANTPFVTTNKGVEGLDFRDGEECLIADTANDFANAIVRMLSDCSLQAKLVEQAESRLQQLYKPQEMLDRRLQIYNQILINPLDK